jgi:uncharacterized membrane protein
VLLIGSGKLRILCVKFHVIVIVLVTVIAIARIKPLLLPKVRARVRQKLRRIAPARA